MAGRITTTHANGITSMIGDSSLLLGIGAGISAFIALIGIEYWTMIGMMGINVIIGMILALVEHDFDPACVLNGLGKRAIVFFAVLAISLMESIAVMHDIAIVTGKSAAVTVTLIYLVFILRQVSRAGIIPDELAIFFRGISEKQDRS